MGLLDGMGWDGICRLLRLKLGGWGIGMRDLGFGFVVGFVVR